MVTTSDSGNDSDSDSDAILSLAMESYKNNSQENSSYQCDIAAAIEKYFPVVEDISSGE